MYKVDPETQPQALFKSKQVVYHYYFEQCLHLHVQQCMCAALAVYNRYSTCMYMYMYMYLRILQEVDHLEFLISSVLPGILSMVASYAFTVSLTLM